jgi:hypothetical protein
VKQERWYRRKQSIAATIAEKIVNHRYYSVSEYFPGSCGEVGPLHRRLEFFFFRNDARDEAVAFTEFHRFARTKPRFQAASVAKLTYVY